MSKLIRAMLISAVATGAAAVVLKTLMPAVPKPSAPRGAGAYVDADELSDEQRDLLMQEMAAEM